jgi:hypothetical protein
MLKLAENTDYLEQEHGFREYRDEKKSELPWFENSLGFI